MYQVKYESVAKAIESECRSFRAILDFGSFQIRDNDVGNIKLSLGSVQNDAPCIGDVVSTQGEIQIVYIPDGETLEGKDFQLYFYLIDPMQRDFVTLQAFADYTLAELHEILYNKTLAEVAEMDISQVRYELIPIAKLTVLKCKKLSDYYTLTCSDRLHFSDSTYKSRLDYPTTSDKVIDEIAAQIGMQAEIEPAQSFLVSKNGTLLLSSNSSRLVTSTWQFDILEKPEGYTKRQMIGYIAAMRGMFAVIDRHGTLVQRWYNHGDDIVFVVGEDGKDLYIDDYEVSETPVSMQYLSCTSKDKSIECGNPSARRMEIDCPYMSKTRLAELYPQVILDYYPCDFTQRLGDPRIELWDRFYESGKQLLPLNMDYTFDGGLMINITSGGDSDTQAQAVGSY